MAIPKVIGTETEYGISAVASPEFNPVISSSLLISTYAGALRRIRWDYEQESPLRDARGFEPVQLREPSEEDLGLANVILPNGARYYVDHAHPEYSTPECVTPRDLVIHDKAGERVLERSLEGIQRTMPGATPCFVGRQIFCGAGKLGGEASWDERSRDRYQVTQRADFFEAEVGLETTLKPPIINTRGEPHADPEKYRRLHVIVGDANLCEVATLLKLGTT